MILCGFDWILLSCINALCQNPSHSLITDFNKLKRPLLVQVWSCYVKHHAILHSYGNLVTFFHIPTWAPARLLEWLFKLVTTDKILNYLKKNNHITIIIIAHWGNRPLALRGHVKSFLWKWKLHDFAFETLLVGHLLKKIIVLWFFKPAPFV